MTRRPRERSIEDYLGAVRRMLRAAARRVAGADEWELAELIALQSDLDDAIAQAVAGQRELGGKSWSAIADGAGVKRQTAHERWSGVTYEL
ncbi:MAG: hypothetical protein KF680_07165 [Cryobacterium sp.]|nr:hypothetical protein [Cryobacterium sp.]